MARKRFGFRRKAKSAARSFKRSVRKQGSTANLMTTMLAAGAYGATRPFIEEKIAPFTSKIPMVGNYADEVALGTVGYLLAKGKMPFFKGKLAKSAGTAILVIESARVGSGLAQGLMPVSGSSAKSNMTNDWGYNG